MTLLPHLAWQHDRDQAIADMDTELGGPGICAWTGVECDQTWPFAPSANFSAWSSMAAPHSSRAHPGCAWLAGKSSVIGPSGSRLRFVLFSMLADSNGLQLANKAGKPQIREWVIDPPPPPFALLVADGGKRHFAWQTPVNYDNDRYTLRFDTALVDIDRADFRALLDDVELIYRTVPKADIEMADTSVGRMRDWGDSERAAWRRIRIRAGTLQLRLAAWLAQKEDQDGK